MLALLHLTCIASVHVGLERFEIAVAKVHYSC